MEIILGIDPDPRALLAASQNLLATCPSTLGPRHSSTSHRYYKNQLAS